MQQTFDDHTIAQLLPRQDNALGDFRGSRDTPVAQASIAFLVRSCTAVCRCLTILAVSTPGTEICRSFRNFAENVVPEMCAKDTRKCSSQHFL